MTSDDLERSKHTVEDKTFYGAYQKNMNEDRPIISGFLIASLLTN